MNHVTQCPKCSHLRYVGMAHECPHGWGKLCNRCERTRVVGRNKRNRRLYPTAKAMWESGASCWRISQEMSIGYETVKRWFKRGQSPFRITRVYQKGEHGKRIPSGFTPPLIPLASRWAR